MIAETPHVVDKRINGATSRSERMKTGGRPRFDRDSFETRSQADQMARFGRWMARTGSADAVKTANLNVRVVKVLALQVASG